MTGTEMQAFNTQLLAGAAMDETFFYQSINMQKGLLEAARDWMVLRAYDNSIAFTAADDFESTKTLPARFSRLYTPYDSQSGYQPAVAIIDANGNKTPLNPVSFASRYDKRETDGYYYLDMLNGKIGRTGTLAGTLHLYFIQNTEDISAGNTWLFPDYAHPILPYKVAISSKGGIDYDTINASQVPFNREDARVIEARLAMWDAQLQQQEIGV